MFDRTGVRTGCEHDRQIRSIAGGRWFTRSWVGDNESEYAAAAAAVAAAMQAIGPSNADTNGSQGDIER